MTNLLDKVVGSFGIFLRFFASSAVGFFVAWASSRAKPSWVSELSTLFGGWAGLALAGVVIGALIYGLHRALIYPFLYWLFIRKFSVCMSKKESLRSFIFEDFVRWNRRDEKESPEVLIMHAMERWADNSHFLFCSAFASLLLPFGLNGASNTNVALPIVCSIVFAISALCSDIRLNVREHFMIHSRAELLELPQLIKKDQLMPISKKTKE